MKEKRNVSEPSSPPDESAQNVSKKIAVGRIIPPFFFESSESGRFSFIYMIRIRFFGSGELIQITFLAAQYAPITCATAKLICKAVSGSYRERDFCRR